jgi:hypothetical protein
MTLVTKSSLCERDEPSFATPLQEKYGLQNSSIEQELVLGKFWVLTTAGFLSFLFDEYT